MTYRLRYRVVEVLRASRQAILPTIIALVALYFGLYAFVGPKGFRALAEQEQKLAEKAAALAIAEEEQAMLEQRVRLLNGKAIDRDLLEEEARRVLNRAHPDEVIVLMPAFANADGPSAPLPEATQR